MYHKNLEKIKKCLWWLTQDKSAEWVIATAASAAGPAHDAGLEFHLLFNPKKPLLSTFEGCLKIWFLRGIFSTQNITHQKLFVVNSPHHRKLTLLIIIRRLLSVEWRRHTVVGRKWFVKISRGWLPLLLFVYWFSKLTKQYDAKIVNCIQSYIIIYKRACMSIVRCVSNENNNGSGTSLLSYTYLGYLEFLTCVSYLK